MVIVRLGSVAWEWGWGVGLGIIQVVDWLLGYIICILLLR